MEFPDAIVELAKQAPMLGIFVYVIFTLIRSEREERAKHESANREERKERDAQFMQFLAEQRNATLATLDVLAMRLQQLGDLVIGIDDRTKRIEKAFDNHDTRAENIAVSVEGLRSVICTDKRDKKAAG